MVNAIESQVSIDMGRCVCMEGERERPLESQLSGRPHLGRTAPSGPGNVLCQD
jgi:hypothetical protein